MKRLLFFVIVLLPLWCMSQSAFDGIWEGRISLGKMDVAFRVKSEKSLFRSHAEMDIPMQAAFGLELEKIKKKGNQISFEHHAGGMKIQFSGLLLGDSVVGEMNQNNVPGTFFLVHKISNKALKKLKKSQPFIEKEVEFYNGDIRLCGTLAMPIKSKSSIPAVVLVSGSGQQNRNEEIFGFQVFKKISDHLASNGIAVLRYDDRGVGGSSGYPALATTKDFAEDAYAALLFLHQQRKIHKGKIGMLGHSEGGIIAGMLSNKKDYSPDFIIMMAAPVLRGKELLLLQNEKIASAEGMNSKHLAEANHVNELLYDAIITGEGSGAALDTFEVYTRKEYARLDSTELLNYADEESHVNMKLAGAKQIFMIPWLKYFIKYDPGEVIPNLQCQTFFLFGGMDMQVPAQENLARLIELKHSAQTDLIEIHTFPRANHLFQKALTGNPNEYEHLDAEFVEGFLETISDWIIKVPMRKSGL